MQEKLIFTLNPNLNELTIAHSNGKHAITVTCNEAYDYNSPVGTFLVSKKDINRVWSFLNQGSNYNANTIGLSDMQDREGVLCDMVYVGINRLEDNELNYPMNEIIRLDYIK